MRCLVGPGRSAYDFHHDSLADAVGFAHLDTSPAIPQTPNSGGFSMVQEEAGLPCGVVSMDLWVS